MNKNTQNSFWLPKSQIVSKKLIVDNLKKGKWMCSYCCEYVAITALISIDGHSHGNYTPHMNRVNVKDDYSDGCGKCCGCVSYNKNMSEGIVSVTPSCDVYGICYDYKQSMSLVNYGLYEYCPICVDTTNCPDCGVRKYNGGLLFTDYQSITFTCDNSRCGREFKPRDQPFKSSSKQ